MVLNIHPIFVHVPIAFLTVYSLLELIRWKKIISKPFWPQLKCIILGIGFLGTLAALQTGQLAAAAYRNTTTRPLVRIHSTYAAITTWYFAILLILYLGHLTNGHFKNRQLRSLTTSLSRLYRILIESWFSVLIGIAGLALITVTGALGGAIVYGPDTDPIVSFIYHLFF